MITAKKWAGVNLSKFCPALAPFYSGINKFMNRWGFNSSRTDLRGHVTDGKTHSYHRWHLIGSLAKVLIEKIVSDAQIRRQSDVEFRQLIARFA